MPLQDNIYTEFFKDQFGLSLKVKEVLYHKESQYQDILIFESESHGTVMVLDDCYMLSDLDEHMYHKALTSYGMQALGVKQGDCFAKARNDGGEAHNDGLNILVIGAGDGGIVRDLFKNWGTQINKVTMVEIDQDVIDVSKKFFPNIASEFDNPKLDLRVEDALAYIKNASEKCFDLVLCDSTDPEGFAAGLIEEDFYRDIKRVLKEAGVFCAQSGSPFFQKEELAKTQKNMAKVFEENHTYYAPMLTYPGVIWSYTAAGKKIHNKDNIDIAEFLASNKETKILVN